MPKVCQYHINIATIKINVLLLCFTLLYFIYYLNFHYIITCHILAAFLKMSKRNRRRKGKKREITKKSNNEASNDAVWNTLECMIVNGYIKAYYRNKFIPNVIIVQIALFYTKENIITVNVYNTRFKHLGHTKHNITSMYYNSTSLYFISMNNDLYVYGNNGDYQLGLEKIKKLKKIIKHEYFSKIGVQLISRSLTSVFSYVYTKNNELYKLGYMRRSYNNGKPIYNNGVFLYGGTQLSCDIFKANIIQIECNGSIVLFLDSKGFIYAIHSPYYAKNQNRIKLMDPNKHKNIKSIGCGESASWMLNNEGLLYGLGIRTNEGQDKLKHISSFSCGNDFVGALTTRNKLIMFGNNEYRQCSGQLSRVGFNVPNIIKILDDKIFDAKCGDFHTIIKTVSNNYYALGNNDNNQCLIHNSMKSISEPTLIDIEYIKKRLKFSYKILDIIPARSVSFIIQDIQ